MILHYYTFLNLPNTMEKPTQADIDNAHEDFLTTLKTPEVESQVGQAGRGQAGL